ncbi:MAG: hypothetical protein EOP83_21785 [Verrucomicrobiaceae bacterium]|nr:MAG: hypothetical protein EOP83_21785 [Verrucomicrobiaceae bacterium]
MKPWKTRMWETYFSFVPDFVAKTNIWYLHPRKVRDAQAFHDWVNTFCPHQVVVRARDSITARYWLSKNAYGFYGCYMQDEGTPEVDVSLPGWFQDALMDNTVFRFRDPEMAFDFKLRYG